MAERPTPQAVFARCVEHASDRSSTACRRSTRHARRRPSVPARDAVALRLCVSAGEALPREIGEQFTAHFGCEILDGIGSTEMLHIFLSNRPGDVRYGTTGTPVPGYDGRAARRGRPAWSPTATSATSTSAGPSAALMYWTSHAKIALDVPGRMDAQRRQIQPPTTTARYVVRRARRRHAEGQRPVRVAVRGRGRARPAPGGARGGRHRPAGRATA